MRQQGEVRLIDRILAGDFYVAAEDEYHVKRPDRETLERFRGMPLQVLVSDAVTEYMYAETDKEVWTWREFPNLAPPFSRFWIETRRPSRIFSDGRVGPWVYPLARWGAVFEEVAPQHAGARWKIQFTMFVEGPDGHRNLGGWGVFELDESGQVLRDDSASPRVGFAMCKAARNRAGASEWAGATQIATLLKPLALAITFMHCKNVPLLENVPAPRLSRAHEKRHGRPLVSYKTLDIWPMRRVLDSEGGARANGLPKALHICRGHFKTYTAERPLLGRATGTYWWPQQVRGSAERGVAAKDYRVHADNPATP